MVQLLCVYLPGNPTIPGVKGICERGVRGGWIGSISSVLLIGGYYVTFQRSDCWGSVCGINSFEDF